LHHYQIDNEYRQGSPKDHFWRPIVTISVIAGVHTARYEADAWIWSITSDLGMQ